MKTFKIFSVIFVCLTIVTAYVSPLITTSDRVRDDVFRLHILANSDSEEDQNLKLKVRDYILSSFDCFKSCNSVDDAIDAAKNNKELIESKANSYIKRLGYSYKATCNVVYEYFSTRVYDSITLPAGYYNSLKIEIGQAKGHNWWCIIFPSVCLSGCTDEDMAQYLDDDEINMIENKRGYAIKFKTVEIYEKIKDKISQKH